MSGGLQKMHSSVVGNSVLPISMRSLGWLRVQFKSSVCCLIFLFVLKFTERGVLKSPAVTMDLSLSPFRSANICFICFYICVIGYIQI